MRKGFFGEVGHSRLSTKGILEDEGVFRAQMSVLGLAVEEGGGGAMVAQWWSSGW